MRVARAGAAIFAALPPPVGGVSSIVAMLHGLLSDRTDLLLATPLPKGNGGLADIVRSGRNFLRLATVAAKVRCGGRVLFFCSAGASFYEKLVWILLLLLIRRRPVMVMVDGRFPPFWDRMPRLVKTVSRFVLDRPSVTLAVQSEQWRRQYQVLFARAELIEIRATVSSAFFDAGADRPAETPPTILYVGWIIPEKGILDLLDAFRVVRQRHQSARLRLVGPMFIELASWEGEVKSRDLTAAVEFVGPILDRTRLIAEMRSVSIFVLPSHFEGFPVSLLESITLGLPSVATSVGGIPDILDDGNAGIVVPPRDPNALATALSDLLADPERRSALSKTGASRARSLYSSRAFIDSYLGALGLK